MVEAASFFFFKREKQRLGKKAENDNEGLTIEIEACDGYQWIDPLVKEVQAGV